MEFSFNVEVARLTHCADEAAFVHRVWYLTYNNEANGRNFRDGKYWTYDSVQALSKVFDFWTPRQLRRIIRNCEELGLIETGKFSENPLDRRTWYTVTEKVKSIYRNGQMDLPEGVNVRDETVKCTCPNGQMLYNEQLKDLLEDQIEDKSARAEKTKTKPEREAWGEFGNVLLSAEEYGRLCDRWGEAQVRQEIEELSAYIASSGKRYKNHCATVTNWLRRKHPQGKSSGMLIEEEWVNE